MSQSDKQEVWHLFCLRIVEAFTLTLNENETPLLPTWAIQVGKKLWRDYLPKIKLPSEKQPREAFLCGFLIGILPQDPEAVNITKSIEEIRSSGAYSPLNAQVPTGPIPSYMEILKQIGSGISEIVSEPPQIKAAFGRGLEAGAMTSLELGNNLFGNGGSPRRTILLHLWLHWPEIGKSRSVAHVYRRLSAALETIGQSNLMGDEERFKKIAQDIGLKFNQKARQGKSKRLRLPIQKQS